MRVSNFFYLFEIIVEINEPSNFDETTNKDRVFERTNLNLGFKITKVKTRRGRLSMFGTHDNYVILHK